MALRLVFIMDPLHAVDVRADSTYAIMREAQERGHRIYYGRQEHLELVSDKPFFTAQPVELGESAAEHRLGPEERLALDEVDAVFMRKDPPFDSEYLISTWILDHIDRRRVVLVNDPQGIRDCNEKLYAVRFPELMPKTWVTRRPARVRELLAEHRDLVVKPLLNAGGAGVMRLQLGDSNVSSILDLLTEEGQRAIEVQSYLPEVTEGDRRVILLAGQPVGVINRRPQQGELRSNMHVGGKAEPAEMSDRDREICAAIGPDLVRRGLVFVGIDVIGGQLTEINVTSPTGIQELKRFTGRCVEAELMDWVEKRRAELV